MYMNCLNNVNTGDRKPSKRLQKQTGDYQSEDRPLNLVFWLLAADHVSESNSPGRVKQKWMQPQVQLHVCAATIRWCSAFRCCCAPTQTSNWPLNPTSFTWRRFRADLSLVCLEVLTYFTVWPNIWWSVLQAKRAEARHRNLRLRRFCTIFCNSDANARTAIKIQNTVLTVFSSDAAGWVAVGLAELLVSCGPSGLAACWEPNERVHERRIELCGDGASWRPAGPIHFFNLTGPLVLFRAYRHTAVLHIHSPRPPLTRQESWGCPPGRLHLHHRCLQMV